VVVSERVVEVDGLHLNIAEAGSGPLVVCCHGFPGLGYSWRHQLPVLAAAGWHAVAPDMLGYGGSSTPADAAQYTHVKTTALLLGLLDALDAPRAVLVGQDFGAPAVWQVALRAPHRVAGLVLLSVPYDPHRLPGPPSQLYAKVARAHFLHTHYFQPHGPADAELAARPREFLSRLFFALSGGYRYTDIWRHPSDGNGYLDVLPDAPPLPWSWLSTAEFDHYVEVFARTGFTGGLNWYRALDANWAENAYVDATVTVPTLFVAGEHEPVLQFLGERALATMRDHVTDLRGVHIVPGAGHWVQQERAAEVNELLAGFVAGLD
jgi:pimeloyl-ACP methyl ester carboxylesterase